MKKAEKELPNTKSDPALGGEGADDSDNNDIGSDSGLKSMATLAVTVGATALVSSYASAADFGMVPGAFEINAAGRVVNEGTRQYAPKISKVMMDAVEHVDVPVVPVIDKVQQAIDSTQKALAQAQSEANIANLKSEVA